MRAKKSVKVKKPVRRNASGVGGIGSALDRRGAKSHTGAMETESARIREHRQLQGAYRLLELEAPSTAAEAAPGQFIHVRIPRAPHLTLRRPFSLLGSDGRNVRVLYKVVGEGTRLLAEASPGETLSIIGPLGNGFPVACDERLPVLVAGGYGVAPLCFLAENLCRKGRVFIGGASAEDILLADAFESLGWRVEIATEDGSLGERGRVTDILDSWLAEAGSSEPLQFFACGPEGLLKAVADRALERAEEAWLSLDRHMGCGVGACLACVVDIREADGGVVRRRVCADGPVFEAREIVWGDTV